MKKRLKRCPTAQESHKYVKAVEIPVNPLQKNVRSWSIAAFTNHQLTQRNASKSAQFPHKYCEGIAAGIIRETLAQQTQNKYGEQPTLLAQRAHSF